MKKTIGILAHVDAGKTTFSEQVLYRAGVIRALGRVDHKDAFLDAHPIERARGITVFSDQAVFEHGVDTYFWLDTPGHVDFSPEMERAIAAMDYAVVIVSCVEGVQSHTETVWHLLEKRGVPTFLFVNKIDRAGANREAALAEIRTRLSSDAVELTGFPDAMSPALIEAVAERDETLLERYFEGHIDPARWTQALKRLVENRKLFPVQYGAALSGEGIDAFLAALFQLTDTRYGDRIGAPFSARIFKVRHDSQGTRVCFFKVLAGSVRVRDEVDGKKLTELRRYQGARFKPVREASAGDLCAAVGILDAKPGEVIGDQSFAASEFAADPMLRASVNFPSEYRIDDVLHALQEIEDEEPTLSVERDASGIGISVMGEVQLEVLASLMHERYNMEIAFGQRRISYLETILAPTIGIGHFEPLRHYAEVHLRLVPGPRGSGIRFESLCHVDELGIQWQRLVETHVFERRHRGVLIGAPLTDVVVQLLIGRAHLKHTEGGDFREATYRAIRCALMNAESAILEPWCTFSLRAPADLYGKITGDLLRMRARCRPPVYVRDVVTIAGDVAFREIIGYGAELTALAHGRGNLSYRLDHYERATDEEALIAAAQYDPERAATADSVFCAKGSGYQVSWREVADYAHCPQDYKRMLE